MERENIELDLGEEMHTGEREITIYQLCRLILISNSLTIITRRSSIDMMNRIVIITLESYFPGMPCE